MKTSLLILVSTLCLVFADNISITDLNSGLVHSDSLDSVGENLSDYYVFKNYFKIYIPESTFSVSLKFTSTGDCGLFLFSQFSLAFPCQNQYGVCSGSEYFETSSHSSLNNTWDLLSSKFAIDTYLYFAVVRSYNNQASPYSNCPFDILVNITNCPQGQVAFSLYGNDTFCKEYINGVFDQTLPLVGKVPPFLYKFTMPPSVNDFNVYIAYNSTDQMYNFGGASSHTPFPGSDEITFYQSVISDIFTGNVYNLTANAIPQGTLYFRGDYDYSMNGTVYFQYQACPDNYAGIDCSSPYIPLNSTNATFTRSIPSLDKEYYYIDIPAESLQEFNITFEIYSGFGIIFLRKNAFPTDGFGTGSAINTFTFYYQTTYVGGRYVFAIDNIKDEELKYSLSITYFNSDVSLNATTTTTTTTSTSSTTSSIDGEISSAVKIYAFIVLVVTAVIFSVL